MTRKKRRMWAVGLVALGLSVAVALVLTAFEENLVFFYGPADIAAQAPPPGRAIRVGGLVEAGSVVHEGATVRFTVTDGAAALPVVYQGILPDLFREGQGVVAEGALGADGVFAAREVLAKHDENYMPPEVADTLKKSGHWEGQ